MIVTIVIGGIDKRFRRAIRDDHDARDAIFRDRSNHDLAFRAGALKTDVDPDLAQEHDEQDREQQLDLFRWRAGHITASVAQRFKRGLDEGYDAFEVFRAVQDHAVDAARAHLDTVVLEAFAAALEASEDPLREPLSLLCDLYALTSLEQAKGFYLEHGRLAPPRCKAITREVNRLCNEVRQLCGQFVDAFGIPDQILAAPIATGQDKASADA